MAVKKVLNRPMAQRSIHLILPRQATLAVEEKDFYLG